MLPAQKSQPKPPPLQLVFESNWDEQFVLTTPVTVTLANKQGSQELGGLEQEKEAPKKEVPSTPAATEAASVCPPLHHAHTATDSDL